MNSVSARKIVDAMSAIKLQQEKLDRDYKMLSAELLKIFKANESEMEVKAFEGSVHKAILVERVDVEYDIKKLKKKLDKETLALIIDKTIKVINFEGLARECKSLGMTANKFKSFFSIVESVSNKKVNEAYECGEINLDKIKDCYSATVTKYIQMRSK